jgi:hypothetical protein
MEESNEAPGRVPNDGVQSGRQWQGPVVMWDIGMLQGVRESKRSIRDDVGMEGKKMVVLCREDGTHCQRGGTRSIREELSTSVSKVTQKRRNEAKRRWKG